VFKWMSKLKGSSEKKDLPSFEEMLIRDAKWFENTLMKFVVEQKEHADYLEMMAAKVQTGTARFSEHVEFQERVKAHYEKYVRDWPY
jgi:hypothetical protein